MVRIKMLLILVLLAACSPLPASVASPTKTPTSPPPTSVVVPTKTPTSSPPVNGAPTLEPGPESSPQEKISEDTYTLVGAFHWVDSHTKTEIMYSYKISFIVKADGVFVSIGESEGAAIGQGGINVDGCVETRPVTMTWTFELLGRKMNTSIDKLDPGILLTAPDLVDKDQMTVFDIALVTPKTQTFKLEPYSVCAENVNMEFAQSLIAFWLDIISELPPPYHLVPADLGTFCTEPLSYESEGLGQLTPCYTITRP